MAKKEYNMAKKENVTEVEVIDLNKPSLSFFKPSVIDISEFVENKSNAKIEDHISFDAYFEILKLENKIIKNHHKEAIKRFVMDKSKLVNLFLTKKEYDDILKGY